MKEQSSPRNIPSQHFSQQFQRVTFTNAGSSERQTLHPGRQVAQEPHHLTPRMPLFDPVHHVGVIELDELVHPMMHPTVL